MMNKQPKTPKVILHYTQGEPYTYKNVHIDCFVDWANSTLTLLSETDPYIQMLKVTIPDDCFAIEVIDENYNAVHSNPKFHTSIHVDCMTAKRRCKIENARSQLFFSIDNMVNEAIKELQDVPVEEDNGRLVWEDHVTPYKKQYIVSEGKLGQYCIEKFTRGYCLFINDNFPRTLPRQSVEDVETEEELKVIAQQLEDEFNAKEKK
jgi:hypothetical protein